MEVYEPYHIAEVAKLDLKEGFAPLNVDGKNSKENLWARDGVVVAHGNDMEIAVGYGQFKNDILPVINNFTYFDLPMSANCYSGKIYD